MADEASSRDNVLVRFEYDANAHEAMTNLRELDSQRQVDLRAATFIVRHGDGWLEIKDEIADDGVSGTVSGGIIELLIGLLVGPFGVLIGGATALLIGSLFDLDDEDDSESVRSDARSVGEAQAHRVLGAVDRHGTSAARSGRGLRLLLDLPSAWRRFAAAVFPHDLPAPLD